MVDAIEGMKLAYAAVADGRAEVPLRLRLPIGSHDALSLFMPAFVRSPGTEALAIKIVSLFPGNPGRGLAFIHQNFNRHFRFSAKILVALNCDSGGGSRGF